MLMMRALRHEAAMPGKDDAADALLIRTLSRRAALFERMFMP